MKWLGSRIRDRNVPQREAAVRYDQRGAIRGTVQSWHGKQCCQEAWAPRDGYPEERPALAKQWANRGDAAQVDLWRAFEQHCVQYWKIIGNLVINFVYNFASNIAQYYT